MSNIVLHIMIIRLKRILPLENFEFIKEESCKLIKPFEFEGWITSWVYDYRSDACLKLYNEMRPISSLPDCTLIEIITRYKERMTPRE